MSRKTKGGKKKHFSGQQRKQYNARLAKTYFLRLEKFAASCGLLETLTNLSKDKTKALLNNSIDKFIVELQHETKTIRDSIKEVLSFLDNQLNQTKFKILTDQDSVSLNEFFTLGWTLFAFLKQNVHSFSQKHDKSEDQLKPLIDIIKKPGGVNEMMGKIYFNLTLFISTIDKGYYRPDTAYGINEKDFPRYFIKIKLEHFPAETINLEIRGKSRPVYRVGWAFPAEKMIWASFNPDDKKTVSGSANPGFPVYIQSHALIRLNERLDCLFSTSITHFLIYDSVSNAKLNSVQSNSFLMEYRYMNFKLGYLVVDLIEDKYIIRTFLLTTQDGTPEGNKLRELAGFNKVDKQYWALDKLSTFISKDLRDNQPLCSLLELAGCTDLLQLESADSQDFMYSRSLADLISFMEQTNQYKSGIDFNF